MAHRGYPNLLPALLRLNTLRKNGSPDFLVNRTRLGGESVRQRDTFSPLNPGIYHGISQRAARSVILVWITMYLPPSALLQ